MAFKFLQALGADDIFISYTRLDASTYAAGLADELTQLGFSCFIDRLGTDPNKDLPDTLRRKIRSCSMLVVVGTPRAAARETIEQEIREFLATGRTSIVPVDFGDAIYDARWYPLVEGIAPEPELNPNALNDGDPSDSVVSRIKKQFNYRRRDERLRRVTRRTAAVLVFLIIGIVAAVLFSRQQLWLAREAMKLASRAEVEANAALSRAVAAQSEGLVAKLGAAVASADAAEQKRRAEDATRDAEEKTRLAEEAAKRAEASEARAVVAQTRADAAQTRADTEQARAERQAAIAEVRAGANRSQNYLRRRPEDVRGSLSLALGALKTAERVGLRSADADSALRESLALLPLRRGRARLDDPKDIAFSPDGLHYATVGAGVLRVYATPGGDDGDATPLLKGRCECEAVALANGLTRAAVVLSFGRGFEILDLKDNSRSRRLPSVKGARRETIASARRLALSPGGRYLALYENEGEGEGRHGKLLVLDTESGKPVRVYDDDVHGEGPVKDIASEPTGRLNTLITDIAFGPTGDLAIVGNRLGTPEGRAVIWRLNADADATGASRALTTDSFNDYEVIPQEQGLIAVAPGADETYFATAKGVWKRPAWQTRFDPVARIPAPTGASFSYVYRMAFRPGGRSLALGRSSLNRSGEEQTSEMIVEVWEAAGHRGRAEAFHTAEVIHAGFEPDGRLVAALTEHDSKNLTGGPLGENRAHRLRVYQTGTGAEVATPEPAVEDRSVFYVGPDAAHIVTLSGKTAKVWDVWEKDEAKRQRAASFGGALNTFEGVALGHGGRFLALAGRNGDGIGVVVYRSDGGAYAEVKRFGLAPGNVRWKDGLTLSADGRRLVVLYMDAKNPARVYDDGVENAALRERLGGLRDVGHVALSANGRYLAVSDQFDFTVDFRPTGRARLLDISEGSWETLLDGELVSAVAFSPDGRYIGLGSSEGMLHVFETARSKDAGDAAKGGARNLKEEVARLQHADRVTAVAFSDDGRYVATASGQPQPYRIGEQESYPLRVWLLRPAELIAESERRLGQVEPPKPYERGL